MKNLFLFIIGFIFTSTQAQKIKIKKDIIYFNKHEAGQIKKNKIEDSLASRKIKAYKVYDKNNQHVFDVEMKFIASPLYGKDKLYSYYVVKYIPTQKEAAINDPNFYLGKKKIIKYLYDNVLFDENGANMDGVEININMADSIPVKIKQEIEKDKEKTKDGYYIINRVKSDPVFFKYIETKDDFSFLNAKTVTTQKYAIYQGKLDPKTGFYQRKTLIGYLLLEYPRGNTKVKPKNIVILNTKNVAVAKVNTFDYHMYFPYKEIPYKARMNKGNEPYSTIFRTKPVLDKANMITLDLIKNNRL